MNISIPQARQRFKILPQSLQDAVFSTQTSEITSKIATQNHLLEDKLPLFAEAIGLVLLGFIHAEDLAKEIQDHVKLDLAIAKNLAEEVSKKLLAPFKADLDRAYTPAPHDEVAPINIATEIVSPSPVTLKPTPVISRPAPVAPPTQNSTSKPFLTPTSTPSVVTPTPSKNPPPLIIHQETIAQPIKKSPVFEPKSFDQFKTGAVRENTAPKPAQVEFGRIIGKTESVMKPVVPTPTPNITIKTPLAQIKPTTPTPAPLPKTSPSQIVNYTELRTAQEPKAEIKPPEPKFNLNINVNTPNNSLTPSPAVNKPVTMPPVAPKLNAVPTAPKSFLPSAPLKPALPPNPPASPSTNSKPPFSFSFLKPKPEEVKPVTPEAPKTMPVPPQIYEIPKNASSGAPNFQINISLPPNSPNPVAPTPLPKPAARPVPPINIINLSNVNPTPPPLTARPAQPQGTGGNTLRATPLKQSIKIVPPQPNGDDVIDLNALRKIHRPKG